MSRFNKITKPQNQPIPESIAPQGGKPRNQLRAGLQNSGKKGGHSSKKK